MEGHLGQGGDLLQVEETGKRPRLVSASLPFLKERPDPVQITTNEGRLVFLHRLLVPWTPVSWWDELKNLFQVDLELGFQNSSASLLDPLHKLALLSVLGSIISVLEDNNRLAEAIVDPKDGRAVAGF